MHCHQHCRQFYNRLFPVIIDQNSPCRCSIPLCACAHRHVWVVAGFLKEINSTQKSSRCREAIRNLLDLLFRLLHGWAWANRLLDAMVLCSPLATGIWAYQTYLLAAFSTCLKTLCSSFRSSTFSYGIQSKDL